MNRSLFIAFPLLSCLAFACASSNDEPTAQSDEAITGSLAQAKACAVRARYESARLGDLHPFDPGETLPTTVPASGIITAAKLDVPDIGSVYVVEHSGVVSFFEANGSIIASLSLLGGETWLSAMGEVLSCTAAPPPSGGIDAGTTLQPTGPTALPACVKRTPIDATAFTYHPAQPAAPAGTCTRADIDRMDAYYRAHQNDPDLRVSQWKQGVSEACASCMFTDEDAPMWGPVVVGADDKVALFNSGGCAEIKSNSEECGMAMSQLEQCRLAACSSCTDRARCMMEFELTESACGQAKQKMLAACDSISPFPSWMDRCKIFSPVTNGLHTQREVACGAPPAPQPAVPSHSHL